MCFKTCYLVMQDTYIAAAEVERYCVLLYQHNEVDQWSHRCQRKPREEQNCLHAFERQVNHHWQTLLLLLKIKNKIRLIWLKNITVWHDYIFIYFKTCIYQLSWAWMLARHLDLDYWQCPFWLPNILVCRAKDVNLLQVQ